LRCDAEAALRAAGHRSGALTLGTSLAEFGLTGGEQRVPLLEESIDAALEGGALGAAGLRVPESGARRFDLSGIVAQCRTVRAQC
jgi:hypothetical protein